MVAVLESLVQLNEWIYIKIYVFVSLAVWTMWCVLVIFCKKSLNLCRQEQVPCDDIYRDLRFYWKWLGKRWKAEDAGKWTVIRILAIISTLFTLVLMVLGLVTALEHQITIVASKAHIYTDQVGALIKHVDSFIVALSGMFPEAARGYIKALLDEMASQLDGSNVTTYMNKNASQVLHGLFSFSTDFVPSFIFFLLYSVFFLLAPLHITSGGEAVKKDLGGIWSRWFGWPVRKKDRDSNQEEAQASSPSSSSEVPAMKRLWGSTSSMFSGDEAQETEELQHYIYKIMWNYFIMLVILNAIFAFLVFLLMSWLGVDLSVIIASVTFFLSFIPELGSIVSMILPIPFILLTPLEEFQHVSNHASCSECTTSNDCVCDFPERFKNVILALVWLMGIKLLVHNFLYSFLMGKNRALSGAVNDTEEADITETHGVIVLFAVMFFANVWGYVGMLISVPAISVMRLCLNLVSSPEHVKKRLSQKYSPRKSGELLRASPRLAAPSR
eukprot:TRINITY_DN48172_c0_g1_i1.p1 TRINITY_DN48172_c0_g1~~TRINITY_DN48172_c0_g1_i1.p1  ORF type:complete len:576 (-),score=78.50 TRINITY_DN48172_c0_g1_i1:29-1525(-)